MIFPDQKQADWIKWRTRGTRRTSAKNLSLHDLVDRIRKLGPILGREFLDGLATLLKQQPQLRQQIALKDLAFINNMAEAHYERGNNPFLVPTQYAKDSGGHWVTIGAHNGHGGSPVFIDKNGKITKGHPGLTDRNVASLDQPYKPERHVDLKHKILKTLRQGTGRISEETHGLESLHKKLDKHPREHVEEALSDLHESGHVNVHTPRFGAPRIYHTDKPFEETTERQRINQSKEYERAVWSKKARKEGMDPASLHQLAAEMLAHDKEYKSEISKMLKDARKTAEHFDEKLGGAAFQNALAQGTFDAASIPHFDEIAATMAVQFPDVFQGHDPDERLADLLQAGAPEPMSQDDAYSEAFEALHEYKNAAAGGEEDPIPFQRKGSAEFEEPATGRNEGAGRLPARPAPHVTAREFLGPRLPGAAPAQFARDPAKSGFTDEELQEMSPEVREATLFLESLIEGMDPSTN